MASCFLVNSLEKRNHFVCFPHLLAKAIATSFHPKMLGNPLMHPPDSLTRLIPKSPNAKPSKKRLAKKMPAFHVCMLVGSNATKPVDWLQAIFFILNIVQRTLKPMFGNVETCLTLLYICAKILKQGGEPREDVKRTFKKSRWHTHVIGCPW